MVDGERRRVKIQRGTSPEHVGAPDRDSELVYTGTSPVQPYRTLNGPRVIHLTLMQEVWTLRIMATPDLKYFVVVLFSPWWC